MEKKINRLESNLLANKKDEMADLAQGALMASGVTSDKEMFLYLNKIDKLCDLIAASTPDCTGDIDKAKCIFDWLWETTPHRYKSEGHCKLTAVIDAQYRNDKDIGNCLGLTALYNVIAQMFGLTVKAVYLESTFGSGPHVCSLLMLNEKTIDIENIFLNGFDYHAHRNAPTREEWSDRELIADIYNSVGSELFAAGKMNRAIENYEKAIQLNPKYSRPLLNKGMALVEAGRTKEAEEWFRKISLQL
jgi:tetratricopeptide (TPR) repeat protein